MIVCDNCKKEVGNNFIRLRMEGIYNKMARKLKISTTPDLCSPECVIEYCSKVRK
ncbi:hypothetical protein ES702_02498 [subsurface metagenome]